jgi:hypothetical protein
MLLFASPLLLVAVILYYTNYLSDRAFQLVYDKAFEEKVIATQSFCTNLEMHMESGIDWYTSN